MEGKIFDLIAEERELSGLDLYGERKEKLKNVSQLEE